MEIFLLITSKALLLKSHGIYEQGNDDGTFRLAWKTPSAYNCIFFKELVKVACVANLIFIFIYYDIIILLIANTIGTEFNFSYVIIMFLGYILECLSWEFGKQYD